ncbi:HYC_CC_PP family protein [Winogradskyella tangerina]|uniref:HYC_CC_PP family protein n=1 Tax=Winogradskyella tangerina TaxID=2023240 RepID=UPI000DBE678C|nr:hypothetical protein [Winogradskyella tangerina]
MKLSVFHKVFSVILAFLVLGSTMSLVIEKHFCGGNLVDVAIFSEIDKCCGGKVDSDSMKVTKKSCCENEVDIVEGQDDLALKSFDDLNETQKQVLVSYAYVLANLYESLPKQIIPHRDYSPPLLIRDIQVLDETYLI